MRNTSELIENGLRDKLLLMSFNLLYENKASFKNLILNQIFALFFKRVDLYQIKNDRTNYFDNTIYLATNEKITKRNYRLFFVVQRFTHKVNRKIHKDGTLVECKPYSYFSWHLNYNNLTYLRVTHALKDLKESAKIWKELAKKYNADWCFCTDREIKSDYVEIAKYKQKKLDDFIKKYQNHLLT